MKTVAGSRYSHETGIESLDGDTESFCTESKLCYPACNRHEQSSGCSITRHSFHIRRGAEALSISKSLRANVPFPVKTSRKKRRGKIARLESSQGANGDPVAIETAFRQYEVECGRVGSQLHGRAKLRLPRLAESPLIRLRTERPVPRPARHSTVRRPIENDDFDLGSIR